MPATAELAPPQLVFGRDKVILYWAELQWSRLTWETENDAFQPARAVGIVWNGDVIGTCLSHALPFPRSDEVILITTHPRWTRRLVISAADGGRLFSISGAS